MAARHNLAEISPCSFCNCFLIMSCFVFSRVIKLIGLERYRYRVSVSNRYLQYRHRNDTKKVSSPIPG